MKGGYQAHGVGMLLSSTQTHSAKPHAPCGRGKQPPCSLFTVVTSAGRGFAPVHTRNRACLIWTLNTGVQSCQKRLSVDGNGDCGAHSLPFNVAGLSVESALYTCAHFCEVDTRTGPGSHLICVGCCCRAVALMGPVMSLCPGSVHTSVELSCNAKWLRKSFCQRQMDPSPLSQLGTMKRETGTQAVAKSQR